MSNYRLAGAKVNEAACKWINYTKLIIFDGKGVTLYKSILSKTYNCNIWNKWYRLSTYYPCDPASGLPGILPTVTLQLLWPSSTTNRLSVSFKMLWPLATTKCCTGSGTDGSLIISSYSIYNRSVLIIIYNRSHSLLYTIGLYIYYIQSASLPIKKWWP